jgi:hypothetical protein
MNACFLGEHVGQILFQECELREFSAALASRLQEGFLIAFIGSTMLSSDAKI